LRQVTEPSQASTIKGRKNAVALQAAGVGPLVRISGEVSMYFERFPKDLLNDVIPLIESRFADSLKAKGVNLKYRETEGAHVWSVWRIT
jgi:hypothetical protein